MNKSRQISVPAAAVRQRGLVLFGLIRRKVCVDCFYNTDWKSIILEVVGILKNLSILKDCRIFKREMKFVELKENTEGEGSNL